MADDVADRSRPPTPEHAIAPYLGPIEEAETDLATAEQERSVAEQRLAAASEAAIKAAERIGTLRAAGKASLSTLDNFPVVHTLHAQMKIDGRIGEFETVSAHISALNAYSRTENPVIAVMGTMAGSDGKLLHFLQPKAGETKEPAITIARDESGHYLGVSTSEGYGLNYALDKYEDLEHSVEDEDDRTDTPVDEIVFIASAEDAERLFEERKRISTPDNVVVYGDEALRKFVGLQAEQTERLRPALFGIMHNMGKQYDGPEMQSASEKKGAQRAFYGNLREYVEDAIVNVVVPQHRGAEEYPLVSREMQAFLDITDAEIAEHVQRRIMMKTTARVYDREVWITTTADPEKLVTPENAWKRVWSSLRDKGKGDFTGLALKETELVNSQFVSATIERDVLEEMLNGFGSFSRFERKKFEKALKQARNSRAQAMKDMSA